jgi:hypothetical protein
MEEEEETTLSQYDHYDISNLTPKSKKEHT